MKKTTIVVEEGGLEFVTPEGRPLARISLIEGEALLTLIGPHGEPSVAVRATSLGGVLSAYGPSGRGRAVMQGIETGGVVSVTDARGNTGGDFSSPNGFGQMCAYRGGIPAAALFAQEHGGSAMVFNGEGRPRVEASVYESEGRLAVYNEAEVPIFVVPVQRLRNFGEERAPDAP